MIVAREGLSAVGAIIGLDHRVRDAGLYRLPRCRRHRAPDRARRHAAAADRHDQRSASARDRLERRAGGLDAGRRHRRQHAAGARSAFRPAHQVRPAGAARGRRHPVRSRRSTTRCGCCSARRPGASTCAAATAPASRRCSQRSRREIKNRAYYWPTTDRLAFQFARQGAGAERDDEDEETPKRAQSASAGFSSGERQIKSLQEIVAHTDAPIYLLDEWDANLDARTAPSPMRWSRSWRARARGRDLASRCGVSRSAVIRTLA